MMRRGTGKRTKRWQLCPPHGQLQGDRPMVWRRIQGREELTPVEARQGFLDRPVLVVLITSVAMVSVLFGLLLLGFV
jgi:hypothetical protein